MPEFSKHKWGALGSAILGVFVSLIAFFLSPFLPIAAVIFAFLVYNLYKDSSFAALCHFIVCIITGLNCVGYTIFLFTKNGDNPYMMFLVVPLWVAAVGFWWGAYHAIKFRDELMVLEKPMIEPENSTA